MSGQATLAEPTGEGAQAMLGPIGPAVLRADALLALLRAPPTLPAGATTLTPIEGGAEDWNAKLLDEVLNARGGVGGALSRSHEVTLEEAVRAHEEALAHGDVLRKAGVARHLRLGYDEGRRLKKALAELMASL